MADVLYGNLDSIPEWAGRGRQCIMTGAALSGMLVSVVARVRNHRDRHMIEIPV